MFKRFLRTFLAAALVLSLALPAFTLAEAPVPLDILFLGLTSTPEDVQKVLDSPVNQVLQDAVGVKITAAAVDDEQKQVILAGGDLTDIVVIRK